MMADIESLSYPLVYKAELNAPIPSGLDEEAGYVAIRAEMRALSGMQKEALIYCGPTGTTWRMVSDEGPYLNGTDLAPFPLAFYTTGMVLSFTDELLKRAEAGGVNIRHLVVTQDNRYTMQGSAIRGDMVGGALPVEIGVEIEADALEETIRQTVSGAEGTSPAQVYMKKVLANTFALGYNGKELALVDVHPSPKKLHGEPTAHLEAARPLSADTYLEDIIVKLEAAKTVIGVEGGAGSSLQATQKRTLHVRGICTLQDDALKEVEVQLFKPLGSTFRFIGDDTGQERAPSSLVYLAAGIGFCFMTQIGRYAQIVKHDLRAYSIVQDTLYKIAADGSDAKPVDTHVFLDMEAPGEAAQRTVTMSERTCFLHAAMRGSTRTKVNIILNGHSLESE
jgi:organic hydroperoxide reductase OsmC/OhrA